MTRIKRIISAVVAVCFILNTAVCDTALALAPKSIFDNITRDIKAEDMARLEKMLTLCLYQAYDPTSRLVSKRALETAAKVYHNDSVFKTRFYVHEISPVTQHWISIKCRTADAQNGNRTYYGIFPANANGKVPEVRIVTEDEFNRMKDAGTFNSIAGLPDEMKREKAMPDDAAAMRRYIEEGEAIDALIAEQYKYNRVLEFGSRSGRLRKEFSEAKKLPPENYLPDELLKPLIDRANSFLRLFGTSFQKAFGNRNVVLVEADNPNVTDTGDFITVKLPGREIRVRSHLSKRALYLIASKDQFRQIKGYEKLPTDFDRSHFANVIADVFVRKVIHEAGVSHDIAWLPVRSPGTESRNVTVEEIENGLDRTFRSYRPDFTKNELNDWLKRQVPTYLTPEDLEKLKGKPVDLDTNLATRDYAMGSVTSPAASSVTTAAVPKSVRFEPEYKRIEDIPGFTLFNYRKLDGTRVLVRLDADPKAFSLENAYSRLAAYVELPNGSWGRAVIPDACKKAIAELSKEMAGRSDLIIIPQRSGTVTSSYDIRSRTKIISVIVGIDEIIIKGERRLTFEVGEGDSGFRLPFLYFAAYDMGQIKAMVSSAAHVVGVPKEIKANATRVGLTPEGVKFLTDRGVKVLVEKGAGRHYFSDRDYRAAGAEIVRRAADVWKRATIIKKVKEPLPEEFKYLRQGLVVFTYLHLASPEPNIKKLVNELVRKKVTGIAYETVERTEGDRKVTPLLRPMSIIAGDLAGYYAVPFCVECGVSAGKAGLTKAGKKTFERIKHEYEEKGSVSGLEESLAGKKAVVLGGGVSGRQMARRLLECGATVTVGDIRAETGEELKEEFAAFGGRFKFRKTKEDINNIDADFLAELKDADILGGCVLDRGGVAPQINRKHLGEISKDKKKFIVDIALDQGGNFHGSYSRHYDDPVFIDEFGNRRFSVPNMPDAVGGIASRELEKTNIGHLLALAMARNIDKAVEILPELSYGVNTYNGEIIYPKVAEAVKGTTAPVADGEAPQTHDAAGRFTPKRGMNPEGAFTVIALTPSLRDDKGFTVRDYMAAYEKFCKEHPEFKFTPNISKTTAKRDLDTLADSNKMRHGIPRLNVDGDKYSTNKSVGFDFDYVSNAVSQREFAFEGRHQAAIWPGFTLFEYTTRSGKNVRIRIAGRSDKFTMVNAEVVALEQDESDRFYWNKVAMPKPCEQAIAEIRKAVAGYSSLHCGRADSNINGITSLFQKILVDGSHPGEITLTIGGNTYHFEEMPTAAAPEGRWSGVPNTAAMRKIVECLSAIELAVGVLSGAYRTGDVIRALEDMGDAQKLARFHRLPTKGDNIGPTIKLALVRLFTDSDIRRYASGIEIAHGKNALTLNLENRSGAVIGIVMRVESARGTKYADFVFGGDAGDGKLFAETKIPCEEIFSKSGRILPALAELKKTAAWRVLTSAEPAGRSAAAVVGKAAKAEPKGRANGWLFLNGGQTLAETRANIAAFVESMPGRRLSDVIKYLAENSKVRVNNAGIIKKYGTIQTVSMGIKLWLSANEYCTIRFDRSKPGSNEWYASIDNSAIFVETQHVNFLKLLAGDGRVVAKPVAPVVGGEAVDMTAPGALELAASEAKKSLKAYFAGMWEGDMSWLDEGTDKQHLKAIIDIWSTVKKVEGIFGEGQLSYGRRFYLAAMIKNAGFPKATVSTGGVETTALGFWYIHSHEWKIVEWAQKLAFVSNMPLQQEERGIKVILRRIDDPEIRLKAIELIGRLELIAQRDLMSLEGINYYSAEQVRSYSRDDMLGLIRDIDKVGTHTSGEKGWASLIGWSYVADSPSMGNAIELTSKVAAHDAKIASATPAAPVVGPAPAATAEPRRRAPAAGTASGETIPQAAEPFNSEANILQSSQDIAPVAGEPAADSALSNDAPATIRAMVNKGEDRFEEIVVKLRDALREIIELENNNYPDKRESAKDHKKALKDICAAIAASPNAAKFMDYMASDRAPIHNSYFMRLKYEFWPSATIAAVKAIPHPEIYAGEPVLNPAPFDAGRSPSGASGLGTIPAAAEPFNPEANIPQFAQDAAPAPNHSLRSGSGQAAGEPMNASQPPAIISDENAITVDHARAIGKKAADKIGMINLVIPYEFVSKEDIEQHRTTLNIDYGDRFRFERFGGMTASADAMLAGIRSKIRSGEEAKTVVLVPLVDDLIAKHLDELARLKAQGVELVFIDKNSVNGMETRADDVGRLRFQMHTFASMALMRYVDKKILEEDALALSGLKYYLKTHFSFAGIATADSYIEAIKKGDVAELIKGYVSFAAFRQYRPADEHFARSYALIFA